MSIIDDVLPIIRTGWGLVQSSGVTKHALTLVTRTWDGGEVGLGTPTVVRLDITPNPEKKENRDGTVKLGPIIPSHTGGGYTVAQLIPADLAGEEYWYELTLDGSDPERYAFGALDDSESFQYFLTLVPLGLKDPE